MHSGLSVTAEQRRRQNVTAKQACSAKIDSVPNE